MKNVSADVAGSDPTAGFTEMAVRELGAERVLYGSDVRGAVSRRNSVRSSDRYSRRCAQTGFGRESAAAAAADHDGERDEGVIDVNVRCVDGRSVAWPVTSLPTWWRAAQERRYRGMGRQLRCAAASRYAAVNARLRPQIARPTARISWCRWLRQPAPAGLAGGSAALPRSAPHAGHPAASQLSRL